MKYCVYSLRCCASFNVFRSDKFMSLLIESISSCVKDFCLSESLLMDTGSGFPKVLNCGVLLPQAIALSLITFEESCSCNFCGMICCRFATDSFLEEHVCVCPGPGSSDEKHFGHNDSSFLASLFSTCMYSLTSIFSLIWARPTLHNIH